MKCTLSDLEQAHMFADAAGILGGGAYLDRETGAFRYLGDTLSGLDDPDAEPEEFDLSDRYLRVPGKRELDLGNVLVYDYAATRLPDDYDRVPDIFRHRGAYRRFKEFLERQDLLEAWTTSTVRHWKPCASGRRTKALSCGKLES
jgi:hypothetical protein